MSRAPFDRIDPWAAATARALLSHAYRNSPATMAVQAAAAIGICVIALPPERPAYLAWLAVVLAVLALRLAANRLLGAALTGQVLANRLSWLAYAQNAGLILSAALWALLACVRMPIDDGTTRYALIIILSALAGGAVGILSALKWTGRVYVSLILLPASAVLILMGQADQALGVLGIIFWAVMIVGHRNNHALLVDAIRLRDENRELLEHVERHSHDVVRANQGLEARVHSRTLELEQLSQAAQAANRAKSQFLATVSHEMRTPLNAILGESQLLERETLTPTQRERVRVMKTASRALRQLIEDILDISQIEAGNLEVRPVDFAVETFAEDIKDLYQTTAGDHGLTLTVSNRSKPGGIRHGDQGRLRQIVGNLVSNALKFTREGGVTVEIGGNDQQMTIAVIDSGVGIDPAQQGAIFQRFVQLDGSSTRKVGGVGLGLAICQELASRMGGSLSVRSELGKGARFDLQVPMPMTHGAQPAVNSEAEFARVPAELANLLVVDDNPVNRRILAALVEPFGVRCGFACDGQEALDAWRTQTWDAIFMDIHMPGMDGIDATQAIRREEAERGLHRIPIVAVTASVLNHEAASYLEAGMDDVLPKPIEAVSLASALARCAAAA